MKKNEGTFDRVLRILIGSALISLVFIGPQSHWGWVGLILLFTGLIGVCPVYSLLGINSSKPGKD